MSYNAFPNPRLAELQLNFVQALVTSSAVITSSHPSANGLPYPFVVGTVSGEVNGIKYSLNGTLAVSSSIHPMDLSDFHAKIRIGGHHATQEAIPRLEGKRFLGTATSSGDHLNASDSDGVSNSENSFQKVRSSYLLMVLISC